MCKPTYSIHWFYLKHCNACFQVDPGEIYYEVLPEEAKVETTICE